MVAGGASGGQSAKEKEEYEQFLEIRMHVKRMQGGTPLLLRAPSSSASGKEELQICTFWLSPDLRAVKWREQDVDGGPSRELPVASILEVTEEPGVDDAEDHGALNVIFEAASGAKQSMSLLCASQEDLITWSAGLRFLAGGPGASGSPGVSGPKGAPAASPKASPKAKAKVSVPKDAAEIEALHRKVREQEEHIGKLNKDNDALRETVRRKDQTIAQLLRDVQGRPSSREQPLNKTSSTSRESDEHLRDRETAILKRKNAKLKATLKAKQKTIDDLLQMLGKALKDQGGETTDASAFEDRDEKSEDSNDSDGGPAAPEPKAAAARAAPQVSRSAATAAAQDDDDDGDDSDPALQSEMRAIAGKLAALEKDVEDLDLEPSAPQKARPATAARKQAPRSPAAVSGSGQFQPPPRVAPTSPGGASVGRQAKETPKRPASAAASSSAAPPASVPSPSGQKHTAHGLDFSLMGGVPPAMAGRKSAEALKVLAKEMATLEEKKRVVEQLAKSLEPPSDNEEDDGFPLR